MKTKFLFQLTIIIVLLSCSNKESNTEIFGSVKGLKRGTLYLERVIDTNLVTIDSLVINGNPEFSFNIDLESPEVIYLFLKKSEGNILPDRLDIFAEPGKIEVQTTLKDFETGAKVTGSTNHDKLKEYHNLMQKYNDRSLDLLQESFESRKVQNEERLSNLENQMQSLRRNKYLATVNFALNNKEHEIAPYLAISEIFDANIKYLDTIYNSLPEKNKISTYGKELEKFITERKQIKKSQE
jgi:hypothetical protein